ncbi:MAG: NAD(P)(+) transhydrogenase (Re/Si-specific) subunit alpha [Rhodospirillaceae bacterium]|nr:NAD(P)(+) transhydrogenase (Re/Si-specific) subunit alpha [Rhodospirillaceae bacterium]|tara:strand:- start:8148 stop:9323 length:1176 start_codon:yes stop_codon:yes gene_type:complete
MKIAVIKERRPNEARVATSPDVVKRFKKLGFDVSIETGAGLGASIVDQAFIDAGATIADEAESAVKNANIVLKVQRPLSAEEGGIDEIELLEPGMILVGTMQSLSHPDQAKKLAESKITVFAMELLPRISRAQSMDVLSSQSSLAGYKAVLDACNEYTRAFPMMMTAAGTIPPARVLVLGAGVAGLQAVATAKRLGAVVHAYDVRPAVKEQVESLGAKFVEVDTAAAADAETSGGYAKEMAEDYKVKQDQVLADVVANTDIVICTALIPGRPAPVLVTPEMVRNMKSGSVIVDLAVEQGGNCPLSELGKVVEKEGVILVGHANVPSRIATDASAMYAKNLYNFIEPMVNAETKDLSINWEDEIISGSLISRDGSIVHPMLRLDIDNEERGK